MQAGHPGHTWHLPLAPKWGCSAGLWVLRVESATEPLPGQGRGRDSDPLLGPGPPYLGTLMEEEKEGGKGTEGRHPLALQVLEHHQERLPRPEPQVMKLASGEGSPGTTAPLLPHSRSGTAASPTPSGFLHK